MKKILLTSVLLLSNFLIYSQVGINNINPKASLDVSATNQATPSNTDGLLIPRIDAFPATNPGANQQGMMVYLTTTSGGKTPGFYYWDNNAGPATWVSVVGVKGTLDEAYDQGGAGVGRTITADNGAVDIQGNDGLTVNGNVSIGSTFNTNYPLRIDAAANTTDRALNINYNGTGTGVLNAIYNNFTTTNTNGSIYANYNNFYSNSSLAEMGFRNDYLSQGSASLYGYANYFSPSGTPNSTIGLYNRFQDNNSPYLYGIYNDSPGAYNLTGTFKGLYNYILASGSGTRYGVFNYFNGGTGTKYGIYNEIPSSAGGIHYGIYTNVQKSTGFAGYFIGRMSLGETPSNRYLMPSADGTANQVMATNGSGQISFVNPSAIFTDTKNTLDQAYDQGGAGVGRTITADNGAVDIQGNDGLTVNGRVGIGTNTANYRLDLNETNGTRGINTAISGTTSGVIYGNYIENSNSQNGNHYGLYSLLSGAGTGLQYGIYQEITNSGGGTHYGFSSSLSGSGNGTQFGNLHEIYNTGSGVHYGTSNHLIGGTGDQYGTRQLIINSGPGNQYGNYNELEQGSSGGKYGTYNSLKFGSGPKFGTHQKIVSYGTENSIGNSNSLDGTGNGIVYGSYHTVTNSGDGDHYGIYSSLSDSGNGNQFGLKQTISNSGSGIHYGSYSILSGTGDGLQYGSRQEISNTGDGVHYGNYSELSGSSNGQQHGNYVVIANTGNNLHQGTYSYLYGSGSGDHYGNKNDLSGSGSGVHYGVHNTLSSTGSGIKYGIYNDFLLAASGSKYGMLNNFESDSGNFFGVTNNITGATNGAVFANYNTLSGEGTGSKTGVFNNFSGANGNSNPYSGFQNTFGDSGNGDRYGIKTVFSSSSTGTGNKYGTYNNIDSSAGGTHYGTYNNVSTNKGWAGYFEGNSYFSNRVGINTTTPDYRLSVSGTTNLNEGITSGTALRVNGDEALWYNGTYFSWGFGGSANYFADNVGIGTTTPSASLEVKRNSTGTLPQLELEENEANDGARINFTNTLETNNYWTLYGRADNTNSTSQFNIYNSVTGNALTATGQGYVGISGTPNIDFHVFHGNSGSSSGMKLQNTNNGNWFRFYVSSSTGDLRLFSTNQGTTSIGNFNDVSGVYTATSDRRLKKDFKDLYFNWNRFMELKPLTYKYKKQKDNKLYIGFVAQDVEPIYPELVNYIKEDDVYQLNYSGFGVVAVKAVQELKKEVATLSEKNQQQEKEIKALKKLVAQYQTLEARLSSLEKNATIETFISEKK